MEREKDDIYEWRIKVVLIGLLTTMVAVLNKIDEDVG